MEHRTGKLLPALLATALTGPPNGATGLTVIPDYGANRMHLTWNDNSSDESGFRVYRGDDGGGFQLLTTTAADVTSWTDTGTTVGPEYAYYVQAFNARGATASNVELQNLRQTWPVPATHELLHGWNDPLGAAAPSGFHRGVDVQRSGSNNQVLATRGGTVLAVTAGPNGGVAIEVTVGATKEWDTYNHLVLAPTYLSVGDVVVSGQTIGEISETFFGTDFVDHVHLLTQDSSGSATRGHPLRNFTDAEDRDPYQVEPGPADHAGSQPGKYLFQQQGAAGTYLTWDATHPVHGDVDFIVDYRDRTGTLPDQVPVELGYWIAPPAPAVSCLTFNGVKGSSAPYLLFSVLNRHLSLAPNQAALLGAIVDTNQDTGPSIVVGGETYPWENYKNFVLTNAGGTTDDPTLVSASQYWNTDAKDDGAPATAAHANYAGMPDTAKAREARFPDGTYTIHVVAEDLVHAGVSDPVPVRLENFAPIVCQTAPTTQLAACTTSTVGFVLFGEPMDGTVDPLAMLSIDGGASLANGLWGDVDFATFTIEDLRAGESYEITIDAALARDLPGTPGGNPLDGDEDGIGGDDYTWTFSIAPAATNYCTPGTTFAGCVPTMSGVGTPSATLASPFTLRADSVDANRTGLIFYGISGPKAALWGTSTSWLCVKSPLQRTPVRLSGGTPGTCEGALVVDWNDFQATSPTALGNPWAAGASVWAQGWFRDPLSPKTTSLSDGLTFVLCP